MGVQVIRQPSGALALFSSYSDTIIGWDLTREEVEAYFLERAVDSDLRSVRRTLDAVEAGRPREAYYQFAMTWEQALATSREHGFDPEDRSAGEGTSDSPDGLEMLARALHARLGNIHPDSAWGVDDGESPWDRAGGGERDYWRQQARDAATEAGVVVVRVQR